MPLDVELHYKTISYTQKHKQQRYLQYKQQIIHDPIKLQLYDVLYAFSYRIFVWGVGL